MKRLIQRVGQDPILAFVDRRHRIHDHEERQQQRHEIAVGYRPGLVIIVLFVSFTSAADYVLLMRETD